MTSNAQLFSINSVQIRSWS